MIVHYKEEMSQIHAPTELISSTKTKMKNESERMKAKKESGASMVKKRKYITAGLSLTAALFMLIVLPVAMGLPNTGTLINKNFSAGNKVFEKEEIKEIGEKVNSEDSLLITEEKEMPKEFDGVQAVKTEEYVFYLLQEEKTGNYKAYVQQGKKAYLLRSKIKNKEVFLQHMDEQLKEIQS